MLQLSKRILDHPTLFLSWCLLLSVSIGTVGKWIYVNNLGVDFGVFWRTANEPIGIVYTQHAFYPFPYPPSAKLLLSPLALLPKWLSYCVWSLISVAALWASIRPALGRWPSLMVVLSPPVTNGIATGQTTALIAATILWGLSTKVRVVAGIAFGVMATIKPQLVLFLPLLLILRRDWFALAGAGGAFAIVLLLTTANYGISVWHEWLAALPDFRATLYLLGIDRFVITIPGVADRFGFRILPFMLIGVLVGTLIVTRAKKNDFIDDAAAIGVASFFVAPYALTYDLTLIAPFLVRQVFRENLLPTLVLAGMPNPLPVLLATAVTFGARLDARHLTDRFRPRPA